MKGSKILLAVLFLLFTAAAAFGQLFSDPNDRIYRDIDRWERLGLVEKMPPLRPYPLQVLTDICRTVAESADKRESGRAGFYLETLEKRMSVRPALAHTSRVTADGRYYGETGGDLIFNSTIHPLVTVNGKYGMWLVDRQDGYLLPDGTNPEKDFLSDWSDFDLFGRNYLVRQTSVVDAAVGTENLYFQAGIMRNSLSPFYYNGAVFGGQAPHTGRFSFVWRSRGITFTTALLTLTATNDAGAGKYPEKFLNFHSFTLYPFPWMELQIFDTVVYGGRFEPLYLVPFSVFFYSQGLLGFPDNSILGFSGKLHFFDALDFSFLLYVDDLHFNDLIRFDFDTKYKLSFQAGAAWSPRIPVLKELTFDYLLVTPYMYTHKSQSTDPADPNYLNYTTAGYNLGPELEPNSDRFTLRAGLFPVEMLETSAVFRLSRHGNASEGITTGDGTLFDDGYDASGSPTFQDTTRFLSQSVIEYNFQVQLGNTLRIPLGKTRGKGVLKVFADYVFEYKHNADLVPGAVRYNNYFTIGAGYDFL